ncbi:MAG: phage holin family protein [Patescibacteria group bacterium]
METVAKLILTIVANLAAVVFASYFVPDFMVTTSAQGLVPLVVTLSLINLTIRPIIKIFLSPLIFVTFGLFTLIINAGILFAVDIFSDYLTINGLLPLLYATSIISVINLLINHSALFLYRRPELS